jgi:hypothetical protein
VPLGDRVSLAGGDRKVPTCVSGSDTERFLWWFGSCEIWDLWALFNRGNRGSGGYLNRGSGYLPTLPPTPPPPLPHPPYPTLPYPSLPYPTLPHRWVRTPKPAYPGPRIRPLGGLLFRGPKPPFRGPPKPGSKFLHRMSDLGVPDRGLGRPVWDPWGGRFGTSN